MAKKILIVGSEPSGIGMISNFLKNQGYATVCARGGVEGSKRFDEQAFDLVLCDLLMPRLNGPELVAHIRCTSDGAGVPVIMMTSIVSSHRSEDDALESWKADASLQKPFEMPELLDKVRGQIGDGEDKPGKLHKVMTNGVIRAFSGTFGDKSYAKVLHLLCKRKANGLLDCKGERKRISIYFKDGRPCNVRSNYIREGSLTRILKTMISLDDGQIEAARGLQKKNKLMQGEALVQSNAISREELSNALRIQAEEKLLTPFGWQEGSFEFIERPVVVDPDLTLKTPLPQIILRGVSQFYSSERIRRSFRDKGGRKIFVNPERTYRLEDFGLSPEELFATSMARSEPTLSQLLNSGKLGTVRTYQILYVMFLLETFKFREADDEQQVQVEIEQPQSRVRLAGLTEEVSMETAEQHYMQSIELYESKDFRAAAARLEQAINIDNRDPRFLAQLALTIYRMPLELKAGYIDPNVLLQRAAQLDRNCVQLSLVMGRLSMEYKDLEKAQMFYQRAIEIEPGNTEAQKELRLLKVMQRQQQSA
ncbi:MAG: response regulator [Candidatus Alcyoniella australis]|nr:response regulator [Candidatus Alcyoniella australis]